MANKETQKVHINKKWFLNVLTECGTSIRKLGEEYAEIQRTERTIRRCLDAGEMSPDTLNRIAQYINVHPYYLSGRLLDKAAAIKNESLRNIFFSRLKPENYPYFLKVREDIDYSTLFGDILAINNISIEQFNTLEPINRVLLRQELALAILEVIAKYFTTDSLGRDIRDDLEYYRDSVGDFDPVSYFAELEGIADREKYEGSNPTEVTEIDGKWAEKYQALLEQPSI